ncbi:MAG: hypothetical protein FWG20_07255, partial [Candidatus Cloacimonetes bacterium]|nr:hypothetical protein [Candidatus Cloacimonadota bacterium]
MQFKKNQVINWLLLLIFSSMVSALFGTWISDIPFSLNQPKTGTKIEAFITGDEFYSYLHNRDGYSMVFDERENAYCWAVFDSNEENLISTGQRVDVVNPESLNIPKRATISETEYRSIRDPFDLLDENMSRSPRLGNSSNITVFINFTENPDCDHDQSVYCNDCEGAKDFPFDHDYYHNFLNGRVALPDTSLYKYIHEVSYGNLTVNSRIITQTVRPDSIVLAYRAPNVSGYYRPYRENGDQYHPANHNGYRNSSENNARLGHLKAGVYEYIKANLDSAFVFTNPEYIDADGDGFIDNITFILKGRLNEPNPADNTNYGIHIFASYKTGGAPNVFLYPGKRVGSIIVCVEDVIWDIQRKRIAVIAAEFSHTLGFRDQYVTIGGPDEPIGVWDLHGGTNYPPQSLTAYTKKKYVPE